MTLPQGGMADAWAGTFNAQPTGSDPVEITRRFTGQRTEAELAQDQSAADKREDERKRERYRAGTAGALRQLARITADLARAEAAISAATEGLREGVGSARTHSAALSAARRGARECRAALDRIQAEEAAAWDGMDSTVRYGITRARLDILTPHATATHLMGEVDKAEPLIDRAEKWESRERDAATARRERLADQYPSLRGGLSSGPAIPVPVTRAAGEYDIQPT